MFRTFDGCFTDPFCNHYNTIEVTKYHKSEVNKNLKKANNMENELILFTDGSIQLEVPVSADGESVWLSANQMAVLFDKDETNIRKHINNVFKSLEVDKSNNTQKMRVDGVIIAAVYQTIFGQDAYSSVEEKAQTYYIL